MTARRVPVLVALCTVALGLAGCGEIGLATPSPSPSTPPPSGIRGRVLLGPVCPVERPAASTPADSPGEPPSASPGEATFDADATPEPEPTVDPGATADPVPTPYPSGCIRPYAASLVITDADGVVRARVSSEDDGSFDVTLVPGDYTVLPQNGDPFPAAQPVDVTVVPGQYAQIQINFDTGIR